MMKTKEPNPYTPASDREVLVDHVNDESNLLTEKELYPSASSKDIVKGTLDNSYKSPGYDTVSRAGSDASLDYRTQATTRLSESVRRRLRRAKAKRHIDREIQSDMAEIAKISKNSSFHASILSLLAKNTGETDEDREEIDSLMLLEQDVAAHNLIANGDKEKEKFLEDRHINLITQLQEKKAKQQAFIKGQETPKVYGLGPAIHIEIPDTNEKGKVEPVAIKETRVRFKDEKPKYKGRSIEERVGQSLSKLNLISMLGYLSLCWTWGGSIGYIAASLLLASWGLYDDTYSEADDLTPRAAMFRIWKVIIRHLVELLLEFLKDRGSQANWVKVLEAIVNAMHTDPPEQKDKPTLATNSNYNNANDEELLSEAKTAGLQAIVPEAEEETANSATTGKKLGKIKKYLDRLGYSRRPVIHKINPKQINSEIPSRHAVYDRETDSTKWVEADTPQHIRLRTPLFGARPFIRVQIERTVIATLLYDTGANCCAFTDKFLDRVEQETGKKIIRSGKTDVSTFGPEDVLADKTMLIMSIPGYRQTSEVEAIVDPKCDEAYDGIFGTNAMRTFRTSIIFPQCGHDIIITHNPVLEEGEVPMETIILEDDDDVPMKISELHGTKINKRRYVPHTVVLDEDMHYLPGKSIFTRAHVSVFTLILKQAMNEKKGMHFVPNAGFENILLEANYHCRPKLKVWTRSGERMTTDDSADERAFAPGGEKYSKGNETALLPKLFLKGTPVGKVQLINYGKEVGEEAEVPVEELQSEGEALETRRTKECVCPYYRDPEVSVILLGDKHGFNYSNSWQYMRPQQELDKLTIASDYQIIGGNVIVFKRHKDRDHYEINAASLQKLLKPKVVILTSLHEDLTRGQLKAIKALKAISQNFTLIKHQSKDCDRCVSLASLPIMTNIEGGLLSKFKTIDVCYSINGTRPTWDFRQRLSHVPEHNFKINNVAHLQVYRVSGKLRVVVHLRDPKRSQDLPDLLVYIQAYLFNQFRLLQVPRDINVLVSWKIEDSKLMPWSKMSSAIQWLPLWDPNTEAYAGIEPNSRLSYVNDWIPECMCKTCIASRDKNLLVPERKFNLITKKDPLDYVDNSTIPISLPKDFDREQYRAEKQAEIACHALSVMVHRKLMISAIHKQVFLDHCRDAKIGQEVKKATIRNIGRKINVDELDKRLHLEEMRENNDRKGREILEQLSPGKQKQVLRRRRLALMKVMREEDKNLEVVPKKINGETDLHSIAENEEGKPKKAPRVTKDNINFDHIKPGPRLPPPDEELIKALKEVDDDMSSTDTDKAIREHIDHYPLEMDANEMIASRHRAGEKWQDYFPKEKLPKNSPELEEFTRIMNEKNSVFSFHKDSWRLMKIKPVHINFDETQPPIIHKYRPMNPIDDYVLTKKLDDLINNDLLMVVPPDSKLFRNVTRLFVVKHNSAAGANMTLNNFNKADLDSIDPSLWRVVADFRNINSTIVNAGYADYVMGTPQEVVSKMGGKNFFVCMDLKSAYRSVPVDAETRRRMTVRADCNLYRHVLLEFRSLVDGIAVAPQIFTQILLDALHDMTDRVAIWIDDITIMATSSAEALKSMEMVLERLEKINALVALDKMQVCLDFNEKTGTGDGQIFSHMGFNIRLVTRYNKVTKLYECQPKLCISETKRKLFGALTVPATYKEVQQKLGCANYLSIFIPNHSVNMIPFYDKLKKGADEKWKPDAAMQRAWEQCMYYILNAADLAIIDYMHTLRIDSDASLLGCGGVLSQDFSNEEGDYKNILGYYSKRFSLELGLHNKYTSVFREVLGLDYCCEHWKKFIYACVRTCLCVDIASAVYMAGARFISDDAHLSRIMARITMLGAVLKIRHRPAKENVLADVLSRNQWSSSVKKGFKGEWITTSTGVPWHHLAITKDVLDKAVYGLPESWLDEKTEITMDELVTNMCEQIARRDDISELAAKRKYQSLIQTCHDRYRPIIREWELKHGSPDIENARVGTMHIQRGMRVARIAYVKISQEEQESIARIDAVHKAQALAGHREHHIDYSEYEVENPIAKLNSERSFLARMQDRCPEVRQIKFEILQNLETPEKLDQRHLEFRLEDNLLLMTRKDASKSFNTLGNQRIYLGEWEALWTLYYDHQRLGHIGLNGARENFQMYFDTGYLSRLCDIVQKSCSACTLYNPMRAKQIHAGRLPRSLQVGQKSYVDVAKVNMGYMPNMEPTDRRILDQTKLVDNIIIFQDSYSGRAIIMPILGQSTETLAAAFKLYQCMQIPIQRVHCDNAPSFYSDKFLQRLRPLGVQGVDYSSPNTSTANSRVERYINTLRSVAWKFAQHMRASSLWYVIYEAMGAINRRPCAQLAKYFPDLGVIPSMEDMYYGLMPTQAQHIIEYVAGELEDIQARIEFRKAVGDVIDQYNQDMEKILEKRNEKEPVTHKIQKGDYVLIRNPDSIHKLGRGNPSFDPTIYQTIDAGHHNKVTVTPAWGVKNRKKEKQNLRHLKKLAAPHAMSYLSPDVIASYGCPFTPERLDKMKKGPEQFKSGIPIPPKTKPQTRSQKSKLTKRKKKWPAMWGNYILGEEGFDTDDEDDDDNEHTPEDAGKIDDSELDPSVYAEDQVYEMDKWPHVWPQTIAEEIPNRDPRIHYQEKKIGDSKEMLLKYYTDNGDPNADSKTEQTWKKLKPAPPQVKIQTPLKSCLKGPERKPARRVAFNLSSEEKEERPASLALTKERKAAFPPKEQLRPGETGTKTLQPRRSKRIGERDLKSEAGSTALSDEKNTLGVRAESSPIKQPASRGRRHIPNQIAKNKEGNTPMRPRRELKKPDRYGQ